MNLLVTGAAGFIGSHYVLRHVETHPDDSVVVLDSLTYAGNKELLNPVMDRIQFVQGDIADTEMVMGLIEKNKIEVIINFAAETHVDRSITSAAPFIQSNVVGVQSLIEVCRKYPKVLLFHISTDEVYGDLQDDEPSKTIDSPLRPSSPYAASKASGDLLVLAAIRTYGIRARISRCTNNFGPHQADEKFIPTVIRSALKDSPVPIYAQGKNKRDWLFVTDHCDAIEVILDKGEDGKIYHVSADSERQNIDVAKEVLGLLQKPESLLSFVTDRPGHDWRYALDSSTTRALGWSPKVGFEEGLKQTVEWYVKRFGEK
jgi:dTDP-glucose 4,6-dehydratase